MPQSKRFCSGLSIQTQVYFCFFLSLEVEDTSDSNGELNSTAIYAFLYYINTCWSNFDLPEIDCLLLYMETRPSRCFPLKWDTKQLNRFNIYRQNSQKKKKSLVGLFIFALKRAKTCKISKGLSRVTSVL